MPVRTAFLAGLVLGWVLGPPDIAAEPLTNAATAASRPGSAPAVRPSSDLDGTYLWLGPVGAASWSAAPSAGTGSGWDSAFGADVAVVRVRERDPIGAVGGSAGASRSTRHFGRLWLDAVIGTAIAGHMVGISAGPILQLSSLRHPQMGASLRIWGFVGIAPYARLGVVGSDAFVEMGIQLPLPVLRR